MRILYIDDIQHPGTASHTGRIILRIYLTFDIITVYYISYNKMAFASDGCPTFGIRYSFIAIAVYYCIYVVALPGDITSWLSSIWSNIYGKYCCLYVNKYTSLIKIPTKMEFCLKMYGEDLHIST